MQTKRRSVLKKLFAAFAAFTAVPVAAKAMSNESNGISYGPTDTIESGENMPDLFSGHTKFAGMVFVAGKGAHFQGDIKSHTDHVLKELEKELIKAGTSMDKVLKVNVYLDDIKDYKGMNEVYLGRFGKNPPVRTTVAVAKGGVPGDSLVEMDCIAMQ
jgi:2-iminobutanoate/2-iminopropanoate deaminase